MSGRVTRATIEATYATIQPHLRLTPTLELSGADFGLAPFRLTLKLEHLQYAGSFKTRGAFANLLLRSVPPAGVVAASGGNHGAAVAYAAMRLGVPACIFVPTVSSPAKIARIREYGAGLVVGGERYADALAASEAFVARSGALAVHAYDQLETLLGQGTVALELSRQAESLDSVLVSVGGGGLIGGIAAWYARGAHDAPASMHAPDLTDLGARLAEDASATRRADAAPGNLLSTSSAPAAEDAPRSPLAAGSVPGGEDAAPGGLGARGTRVIGVEPEHAPTLTAALAAGRPVDAEAGSIAADSLAPRQVGQLMFPIARQHVARVALVSDDAIRAAQLALWHTVRLVVEPGGAAAFAALLSGAYHADIDEHVGVVLSGANTTAVDFLSA